MISDFINTCIEFIKAPSYLFKYRLWKYPFLAIIACLGIGALFLSAGYGFSDNLANWILSWFGVTSIIAGNVAQWVTTIFLWVAFFLVYKYIVIIVVSPFMSPLSEKLENELLGYDEPVAFNLQQVLKDLMRGLRINIKNLFKELGLTILLFILSLIPMLAVVTTPLLFIIQAYYAGFGNMDYFMERHFNDKEAGYFVRDFKGIAIANGTLFLVLLMIPVVGLILAPTLATISATVMCAQKVEVR